MLKPRVLLGWELGSGRGHLGKLSGLAEAFGARGWETFCALARLESARSYFPNATLLQAPFVQLRGRPEVARTWSDILRPFGWTDPRMLASLVGQWRLTADLVQPDLIVLDAAPTALLALGGRWPIARFSVPFFQPPPRSPLPAFAPGDHSEREAELVRIAESASGRTLASLAEMMRGVPGWVASSPVLDPWERGEERPVYAGPSARTDHGAPVVWPDVGGPRIFGYLNPRTPVTRVLLDHLAQCEASSVVSCALPPAQLESLRSASLHLSAEPFHIGQAVQGADLVVTHSAFGTASTFLAGGVPALLIPRQHEQRAAAEAVCRNRLGVQLKQNGSTEEVAAALEQVLQPRFREEASRRAPEFVSLDRATVVEQMIAVSTAD